MKKIGILHGRLSAVLAELGHTDALVIADAGLPIPPGVERIDLALVASVPGFVEPLRAVLSELTVESAIVADELGVHSPHMHAQTRQLLGSLRSSLVTAGPFHASFEHQDLRGINARSAFAEFVERYPDARGYPARAIQRACC